MSDIKFNPEPDEDDTEDTSLSNFFAEIDIENLSKDEIFAKMMSMGKV